MDWNDGYVTDIAYTSGAYQEMSPTHLHCVCALSGFEPVAIDRPFNYLELGCGRGITTNVLAATHPHAFFQGVDFMPSHIASATDLALSARIDNVRFLDCSFADLASGNVQLPMFDFIALHGVYSWVSHANRRHIVTVLSRCLRPGGLVYVSYNAMPGWASAAPLQRLLLDLARTGTGDSQSRFLQARNMAQRLAGSGFSYFDSATHIGTRLKALETDNPRYLTHEYLNEHWQPLYHADVVLDFAAAKLDYVAPAQLCRSKRYWPETIAAEHRQILDALPDDSLRETARDYLSNTLFRADVFVRGARPLSAARHRSMLGDIGVALTAPAPAQANGSAAAVAEDEASALLVEALCDGPRSFDQLLAMPGPLHGQQRLVEQLVAFLAAMNRVSVFSTGLPDADCGPSLRLNRTLASEARLHDNFQVLASVRIGNGVPAGLLQRLVYLAIQEGAAPDAPDAIAERVWLDVCAQSAQAGARAPMDGWPTECETHDTVRLILEMRLPLWRQLHMV
jgi:trans-aconitate methyltransferase